MLLLRGAHLVLRSSCPHSTWWMSRWSMLRCVCQWCLGKVEKVLEKKNKHQFFMSKSMYAIWETYATVLRCLYLDGPLICSLHKNGCFKQETLQSIVYFVSSFLATNLHRLLLFLLQADGLTAFLEPLLCLDPEERPSAATALQHPWLTTVNSRTNKEGWLVYIPCLSFDSCYWTTAACTTVTNC